MIPCFVCGTDASTGWTKGFAPAPDSQKLALCAEHNTQENRLAVARAWQNMLRSEIASMTDVARAKAAPFEQLITVHFNGGGMLSFICIACGTTAQNTLRIDAPDGSRTYIPMQHVREYSVRPHMDEDVPGREPKNLASGIAKSGTSLLLPSSGGTP